MFDIGVSLILTSQDRGKVVFKVGQCDSVLGSGRSGNGRRNLRQIHFEHLGVFGIFRSGIEKPQRLRAMFYNFSLLLSIRQFKIIDGLFINREEPHGGAVFRGHVRQGGPVRYGQFFHAGTKVFDKFFNYAVVSEHFGDAQHQIRGRHPFL